MTTPDKMIPHNVEAEEAVLGSLLIDPEALFRVAPFLKGDDFYIQKNGWIYEAVLALHEQRAPIDFVTLCDELEHREQLEEIGGSAYITRLINAVPSAIHVESYGHIVEHAAIRRRLIGAASEIAQLAYQEEEDVDRTVDKAEQALFSVSQRRITRDLAPIQDIIRDYYDRIEYLYAHQGEPLGVPTGFIDIDRLLGGMQRSDFIIVAARPSVGKTSLCLSFARNAARHGKHVAIFSLEMSGAQIVQRIVSAETGIDAQRLRLGNLREDEWPLFVQATGKLADHPIFIDDTPAISALQLRTKARRLHAEHGLDLVLIDYLQLMSGDTRSENRVQEVSYISRSLKAIARELDVPVVAASQLSRAVEQRAEKVPMLADLRESGCLAGDTLVQMANGQRVAISQLVERNTSIPVMALNETTWKLESIKARKAWLVGTKPVFRLCTQLGREIKATANHKFRTLNEWKRLDQLEPGEHIALPRSWEHLPTPTATISKAGAALLGHLIGDGCTLPRHAVQYTTNNKELADIVADLATEVFGDTIATRVEQQRNWWQVFLSATAHLTHKTRNPVAEWMDNLGVWGYRSHEKFIPTTLFEQPPETIRQFLRHLWATDGTLGVFGQKTPRAIACYATSSQRLAWDVQHLLLRLGIVARTSCVPQRNKGRDQWHVTVTSKPNVMAFVEQIGVVGPKQVRIETIREFYRNRGYLPNSDVIPGIVWHSLVEPARQAIGLNQSTFQRALGRRYASGNLYRGNLSRARALRVGQIVQSNALIRLSQSDVYWDQVASIRYAGVEDVFDLEVPGHHNFVAGDIILHNSLEQDADVVMFIYRDEMYHPETEKQHIADIIVAKHRNGPTGTVQLFFRNRLAQFLDAETRQQPVDFG